MNINDIVMTAASMKTSDIHLVAGLPPRVRVDGALTDLTPEKLTAADTLRLCRELAGESLDDILALGQLDFSATIAGERCRMNIFKQQGAFSAAIRILSSKIPKLDSLGLPPAVQDFTKLRQGIVLVTGQTGSGKSTTLAAILNEINQNRAVHILTLEDPVEYLYTPAKSVINQREIGKDTESFATGLRAALREDPDVILVGEMRDLDTIETALTAAETGHLVFGTLHTMSAPDTIDRIVDVFSAERQKQIRMQLSMTLKAVVAQQLLPKRMGGRVAACELMIVNSAIRNLIREGKTPQIANAIQTSSAEGSQTLESALANLLKNRVISNETALSAAQDVDMLRRLAHI